MFFFVKWATAAEFLFLVSMITKEPDEPIKIDIMIFFTISDYKNADIYNLVENLSKHIDPYHIVICGTNGVIFAINYNLRANA